MARTRSSAGAGASKQLGREPGNRLGGETSPYLLQHKDNPVHWRPWGKPALAEAKASGKPVMISIGYAACHWCHVMAHESFENAETAALMNELFVNIKVDREERPDIDSFYQHALQLLGEHGGWPLTMFLTAEGEPFWGGTYFPGEAKYGRPGFRDVLRQISRIYKEEPDKVSANAAAINGALAQLAEADAGDLPGIDTIDGVASQLLKMVDSVNGGIGGAPKFPQVPIFELLWRAYKRGLGPQYRNAVTLTLDRMCQGGIYDHLGGGFARYSVDNYWLAPHFEKMLYDNAQLIDLLTLVWQETGNPLYEQRIAETIGWLQREMVIGRGGFAGSLDADSEGEEGRFTVWTLPEIDAVLGPEAAFFKEAYDVGAAGNWEGKTILNRGKRPALGGKAEEARLAEARAKLLAVRDKRVRPGLDDKVLADWNGLAIAALCNAGLVFERPEWIEAAVSAFDFVLEEMIVDGKLQHSWCAGRPAHPATLDDYANLCRAALALHEVRGDDRYISQAIAWIGILESGYADSGANGEGGYFFTAADVDDVSVREKTALDNAAPAGNATLIGVLARLYYLTGKKTYRTGAENLVRAFSGGLQRNIFSHATLLNNCEFLQDALQVVLCGGEAESFERKAMRQAVLRYSLPNRVLLHIATGAGLPSSHPAHGKEPKGNKLTAFICRGTTCSLPLSDPDSVSAHLAE
ncbi:MAG: thioredoxin domain-containing protein [Alphaproteobacteria bacterium]